MSDRKPIQGWTNALLEDDPQLEGWLNSTVTAIKATSTIDLICKVAEELEEINKTLSVFGIADLLHSNNSAIVMKIHVSDWIAADIKGGIPPSMSWTMAKFAPSKGDITFLSQTALRAGALLNGTNNKKFATNFLIPMESKCQNSSRIT
jgi:hypothetical protein